MPKKLEALMDFIYEYNYSLTPSETMIIQRERNELKYNLLEAFIEVLIEAGLERNLIHRTTDGYILEAENAEHGMIPVHIDIKIKNMDYPLEEAILEWEHKVWEKQEKERKAERAEEEKERRRLERQRIQAARKERVQTEYEEYKNKKADTSVEED